MQLFQGGKSHFYRYQDLKLSSLRNSMLRIQPTLKGLSIKIIWKKFCYSPNRDFHLKNNFRFTI